MIRQWVDIARGHSFGLDESSSYSRHFAGYVSEPRRQVTWNPDSTVVLRSSWSRLDTSASADVCLDNLEPYFAELCIVVSRPVGRQRQELVQPAQGVQQLERQRVDGVAAGIAEEIGCAF